MLSVLFVDDDDAILDVGRTFLEQSGKIRVDISRSARDALTLVASDQYDAIISDYAMPEMDGITFLDNIRNSGNTVPFIFFTGRGREDVVIDAFHSGADDYLRKDGEAESRFAELILAIEKSVERKRAGAAPEHAHALLMSTLESTEDEDEDLKFRSEVSDGQWFLLQGSKSDYRRVFDAGSDPLLVADRRTGAILDINTASCRVYGYTRDEMLGLSLSDLFARPGRDHLDKNEECNAIRESRHRKKNGMIFPVEVLCSELVLENRDVLVLYIHDATRTKLVEDALKLANMKLSLLFGITRHDILNKLTTLAVSNEILSSRLTDAGDQDILNLQGKAIRGIQQHIDFTREYDQLGLGGPCWLPVSNMIRRAYAHFLQTVSFRCEIGDLEIYTDPMIEKVFYNLFDNAFRYGERVTEISVSWSQKGNDLNLLFRDDGIGIQASEKERIFERGYGKNTGLGLFFSREILSLTGLEIHETGEYLNGARFEIHIPEGLFRFSNPHGEPFLYHDRTGPVIHNGCCEQEN